jgi:carboxypeptidase Taq
MNAPQELSQLKQLLRDVFDLESAASILYWDQATYMPPNAGETRGRQLALLARLSHERSTDAALGKLLDKLRPWAESQPAGHRDADLVRVAARDFERALKLPVAFVSEFSEHQSKTYEAWIKARPANDFKGVQPLLEKTLDLSRRQASFYKGYAHPIDAFLDGDEQGMTIAFLKPLFSELRKELVGLLQEVRAKGDVDDGCLRGHYPEAEQVAFGEKIIRKFGYDFARGRQDKTHHPFMTKLGMNDIRITTRFRDNDLTDALFSTLHETGHALYEQGLDPDFDGTPLASGVSTGVHESQSRLWENMVGRSHGFWEHWYPELQKQFPEPFAKLELNTFYRAINRVAPSLIRVDADELTYNLHVLVRFELEMELHDGVLEIKDLPHAWHAKYKEYLGVTAPDDRDGCLQDVHWYGGRIGGYFQGYTLGNILAAQFFAAAVKANASIPSEIRKGEYSGLLGWLRENVHRHGRARTPREIVTSATGQDLSLKPYIAYLRGKYLGSPYAG